MYMPNRKKINFNKINIAKIGKIVGRFFITVARHPFFSAFVIFSIAVLVGLAVFYKYSSLDPARQGKSSDLFFKEYLYKKVLETQATQKKDFENAGTGFIRDPFRESK